MDPERLQHKADFVKAHNARALAGSGDVNPTKIQQMAATCRFGHWYNPAASDSNPVTPVFYFGWRQP